MGDTAQNERRRRAIRRFTSLVAVVVMAASCVPTSPSPAVRTRPEGRGIVSGVDVAPSYGCSPEADPGPPAGTTELELSIGGSTRVAEIRVPVGPGPHPLLISLHPFTSGAEAWEQYSGLAEAAVARGYVVASPTGSQPGPRWAVPGSLETGADDVGFVAELSDHLEDTLCIDRNAEFAAGYSAGAAMAQALSCTMPWRFAAVAGSGGMNLTETCEDSPPTDVMIMHGSVDPIAPPTGSVIVFAPPMGLHINTVASVNAARAGCDPTPAISTPAGSVEARTFTSCGDDHRVTYWRMLGAGHTWAGTAGAAFSPVVGPTSQSFSATEVVLDFFDAA